MMDDMQLFRFRFRHSQQKKILYIHGGYNILQPSAFHWRFMDKLALSTLYEVVLPIYPKHLNIMLRIHMLRFIKCINNY